MTTRLFSKARRNRLADTGFQIIERLRITPNPSHNHEMMVELTRALVWVFERLGIKPGAEKLAAAA